MACLQPGQEVIDFDWCVYQRSRLRFRGPGRALQGRFCAVLGGAEVLGRSVATPFAALVEERLGLPVVNLGVPNCGPDVFLGDEGVTAILDRAEVTVIEVLGAHNLSNRYYSVHPRRNDRFVGATPMLRALYPDVDFTEFNFTRHMLSALAARDPSAFGRLAGCLRRTWLERMTRLLEAAHGRRLLLLLPDGQHDPVQGCCPLGPEPLLVDAAMVQALAEHADGVLRLDDPGPGVPDAAALPEAARHAAIAARLAPAMAALIAQPGP